MNKKSSLNNLLYIQEHRSCRNYLEKVENGFKYIEFSHEEVILEKEISVYPVRHKIKIEKMN